MENKKMTKKDYFNILLGIEEVSNNSELVAFIEHEVDLLNKKSSKSSETKTQIENKGIKDTIVKVLSNFENPATIAEIQDSNESLKALSNQKISALLKQLVDSEVIVRVVDKKKTYFSLKSV